MSYRVALGGKAFIKDWLEAADVNGIPHAFVVSDGKIAWMGHPVQLTPELIGDILTGTPLAAAAPVADKVPQRKAGKRPAAKAEDPEMAAAQAKLDALSEAMGRRKELREAIEAQIGLGRGDPTKFYAQLARVAEEEFDDAEALNEIAWRLLTTKALARKLNLPLAEKCAVQAVKLTKEEHSDKLDTLARVRWLQGRKEEAIRLQIRAVDKAAEPEMKALLQKTLDALLKGVLPPADEEDDPAR